MDTIQRFLTSATVQLLSVSIREQLEQWFCSSKELSIFVSVRTGGGKSTLVNSLLGAKLAEEGAEPKPATAEIDCYERRVGEILVKVWDSPGLQDGTKHEERYLNDIAARCNTSVDLFLFCINVGDATRFNQDSPEVKALAKLTAKLSPVIWNHAIIALTFANRLGQTSMEMRLAKRRKDKDKVRDLFCKKVDEWEQRLRRFLPEIGLSSNQIQKLKIVPTGHRRDPSLPDRPHWLSTFWFEALRSTHPRAQPALLRMNETRIVENPDTVDEKTHRQHSEDQAFIFSQFGGNVGRLMCGSEDLGSIAGLAMADFKDIELKERIVLEQFFIMNTIPQTSAEDYPRSPPPLSIGDGVEQDMLVSPLDVSFSQLGLGQTPTTSPAVSVPTATSDGSGVEATPGDGLQGEEEESLSSLASPKSVCGGHPYHE